MLLCTNFNVFCTEFNLFLRLNRFEMGPQCLKLRLLGFLRLLYIHCNPNETSMHGSMYIKMYHVHASDCSLQCRSIYSKANRQQDICRNMVHRPKQRWVNEEHWLPSGRSNPDWNTSAQTTEPQLSARQKSVYQYYHILTCMLQYWDSCIWQTTQTMSLYCSANIPLCWYLFKTCNFQMSFSSVTVSLCSE